MATAMKMPMKKGMPFGKKAMPTMGKPKTMKAFEKSPFDKEPKGMKEGSKADKVLDKKQFAKAKK
jgi:hypothetical protein